MAMVDPGILVDAVVAALQSNAPLIALLGTLSPTDAVFAYHTNYTRGQSNLEQRIFDQKPNSIMVCWTGTETGRLRNGETIRHGFAMYLKPTSQVSTVFQAVREGVCTIPGGDTRKFKLLTIDASVNPPENLAIRARTNFISQNYGLFDFAEITFTLAERGVDD